MRTERLERHLNCLAYRLSKAGDAPRILIKPQEARELLEDVRALLVERSWANSSGDDMGR